MSKASSVVATVTQQSRQRVHYALTWMPCENGALYSFYSIFQSRLDTALTRTQS